MGMRVCKKCRFTNRNADLANKDEECPLCGAIYSKVDARIHKTKEFEDIEKSRMLRLSARMDVIVTVFLFFTIFSVDYGNIIVKNNISFLFNKISLALVLFWIVCAIVGFLTKDNAFFYFCTIKSRQSVAGCFYATSLVIFIAGIFTIYINICLGVPKLLHLFSQKRDGVLVVTPIERHFLTRGCRNGFILLKIRIF